MDERAPSRVQRARALSASGDHAAALELLDDALAADGADADAHFLRAVVLVALGREPEARRAFAKSIELRPDFAAALSLALTVAPRNGETPPEI